MHLFYLLMKLVSKQPLYLYTILLTQFFDTLIFFLYYKLSINKYLLTTLFIVLLASKVFLILLDTKNLNEYNVLACILFVIFSIINLYLFVFVVSNFDSVKVVYRFIPTFMFLAVLVGLMELGLVSYLVIVLCYVNGGSNVNYINR